MQHLRKLTARTMGLSKFIVDQSYIVYGKVRRYETGQSDYGPYVKFRGQFEGMNEQTGEYASAPVVIFPGGLLEDELMEAVDESNQSVDIAIRFKMVENPSSPTNVSWEAERLIEDRDSDPLADLRKQMLPSE